MKAMTPKQYVDLLEYIKTNYRFGMGGKTSKFPFGIKYISATFDTRVGDIYRVVIHKDFDNGDITLSTTNIREDDERKNFENLYDYVIHFLNS